MSSSWQQFFPFEEWRPAQAEGLDFLEENLGRTDDILIVGPTGVGKSALVLAEARSLASRGIDSYITTLSLALEAQYMDDFSKFGLRRLHAKSHYDCPECRTCDLGQLSVKTTIGKRRRCRQSACTYQIAKAAFCAAPFSITNTAYACTCARHAADWEPRPVAFFDEAHELQDKICSQYSIEIYAQDVDYFPADDPVAQVNWLHHEYKFWLKTQIRELEEDLDELDDDDPELPRTLKKLERATEKLNNLEKFLGDDPDKWVFDQQEDRLTISPVWATDIAPGLLARIGGQRVYLSATMPGFKQQARYLGIDPAGAKYLALDCPFPVENRLIHICPVVKWDWRNPVPAIGQTCRVLEKILELHPSDRGLVHVSSYRQAREIVETCRNRRLVTHTDARDKDVRLEEMYARPGTVLVSPSSHEGLDLYGDRSRFQVIAKLPFANRKDKRVLRRDQTDDQWYNLHTAQKLIQACGRSIRSDSDYAITYILDRAFVDDKGKQGFASRAWQFFPEYFRQSLREKEVDL